MSTFALIHGAWHGPWCWERLTPELERRGHRVVAVDVRFDDPAATFEDRAATFAAALDDDETVVVGHSLSGHVLPWVARLRPVRHLVYLCALVGDPGRSAAYQEREGSMLDDVVAAALPRLRPQAIGPIMQRCGLDRLPAVPATYIVCAEDRMVDPAWSRRIAAGRLGAELVELPGGHSPFFSRPAALAEALDRLV